METLTGFGLVLLVKVHLGLKLVLPMCERTRIHELTHPGELVVLAQLGLLLTRVLLHVATLLLRSFEKPPFRANIEFKVLTITTLSCGLR
jgi:hypothetical protein